MGGNGRAGRKRFGIAKRGKGVWRDGKGVGISATLAYPLPPLDLRVLAATCPNFQNFLCVCTSGFMDDYVLKKAQIQMQAISELFTVTRRARNLLSTIALLLSCAVLLALLSVMISVT